MRESVSAQWTPRLCAVSVHPYSEKESRRFNSVGVVNVFVSEWENKQQTTNITSYICVQLERQASLLRAVFTRSPAERRGRLLITKWSAAAVHLYIHTRST